MKTKVTSHKTSEALARAGFDLEDHTGWWEISWDDYSTVTHAEHIMPPMKSHPAFDYVKAYSCYELIEGLQKLIPDEGIISELIEKLGSIVMGYHNQESTQEALAQAICVILKDNDAS